jgi:hypothetical protein
MPHKSLLIAVAAFAMTATGAQAYVGTKHLERSGFNSEQVRAFTQARQLQTEGEFKKARDLLVEAGVDENSVGQLRHVAYDIHRAITMAVVANDFAAFKVAVAGSPLADIVTTEADFVVFSDAHAAKQAGRYVEARSLFDDLGLPHAILNNYKQTKSHHSAYSRSGLSLSAEEADALRAARQANDTETVRAILEEAGVIEFWPKREVWLNRAVQKSFEALE